MTYCYFAYGLSINSDIPLQPLPVCDSPTAVSSQHSLTVSAGTVIETGWSDESTGLLYCHAEPGRVWLRVPNVARFLIEGGECITYEVEPRFDDLDSVLLDVALFLQSHCIPYILMQKEFTVLRASAVNINNQAVLFAGHTHAGKSTYAAVLHHRHFDVICDDICAIDADGRLLPGYPYLKLWADILSYLRYTPHDCSAVRKSLDKYVFPLELGFCDKRLPLGHAFVVESNRSGRWYTQSLSGVDKLKQLQQFLYRPAVHTAQELASPTPRLLQIVQDISVTKATWPDATMRTGVKLRLAEQVQFFLDEVDKAQPVT